MSEDASKPLERRVTLIIDADDTLWENNVHFEEATERFLDMAERYGGERRAVRERLEDIERRNVPVHGYGSAGFARSLLDTLEELTGQPASAADRERIGALGDGVRMMPIEFLPDVRETLEVLRRDHRLILFTKGDHEEQSAKVERSGAAVMFHEVEVTGEKRPDDYRRLIRHHSIVPESSWMVGNSPRSDINPALEVGLGAVFIPHQSTWALEHATVEPRRGARLKILKRFRELLDHFAPHRIGRS